jgi:CRP-like cAMP-binding protein
VSTDDFRLALNEPISTELTDGHDQAAREFIALCRRHDEDPREQQRIRDIDAAITADETCYSLAEAALERGDADAALGLLQPAAESGVGEARWLLASLLEETGDSAEAISWYQRAAADGDSRAARKLLEIQHPDRMPSNVVDLGVVHAARTTLAAAAADPGPAAGRLIAGDLTEASSRSFWDALSAAERQVFAARARERTFARGATLMREGEPGDYVIVILSGWTRITTSRGSQPQVVAERGPGQLIGELAALRVSTRSATVVALDTIQALQMDVPDFADFLGAHPDLLSLVESHAEDRLAEQPRALLGTASYSPAGYRSIGKHSETYAAAPTLTPRPFRGENCTVIYTDVVGFARPTRNDEDRLIIRRALLEMTMTALGHLRDMCYWEDRGDGLLIVAPPSIPTVEILDNVLGGLSFALKRHNRIYGPQTQIQLCLASDVGPVISDTLGVQGEAIIRAARMIEARALKSSIARNHANLGVVISEFAYNVAIAQPGSLIDPADYRRIHVDVKETSQPAWMKIIDPAVKSFGVVFRG